METAMDKWVLPTEPSKLSNRWIDQKFLLIGDGKIGKSEFVAQDPNALFIETEPGLNHLQVKKLACRSWDDMREIYMALYEAMREGKFPYSTIVIDTIDKLINYSQEECIVRGKAKFTKMADQINSIGDIPEGQGWIWSIQMIDNMLTKLDEFPAALMLIGHVQNKEIKEPTRVIHKDTINIGGQLGIKLLHWTDHTLHIKSRYEGTKIMRTVRTIPTDTMSAGSRGRIVPDGMAWGDDAKENWEALRKLFT